MKKMSLLLVICLGIPATIAFADRIDPASVGGQRVDVCDADDCSQTGISKVAGEVCAQNGRGNKATNWAIKGIAATPLQHFGPTASGGHGFQPASSSVEFTWIDCSP